MGWALCSVCWRYPSLLFLQSCQPQLGKAWLAREIGQTLGDPDFTIAMDGLNLMGITAFRRSTNMATGNLSI